MSDIQDRLAAFVDDLAAAIGELAGAPAEAHAGSAPQERSWIATLEGAGEGGGRLAIALDHAGAAALSRLVSPGQGEVEDASIADLLRKAIVKAATTLASRPGGIELTLSTLEPQAPGDAIEGQDYLISAGGLAAPLSVRAMWLDAPREAGTPAVPAETDEQLGNRIDVILDIDLPVVVRFGHTELPIRTLTRLGPGSVIDLGRSPDDPVDVLVSNRVVARGEVVIVGGNYGVRILDVTSQSERVRSMEG